MSYGRSPYFIIEDGNGDFRVYTPGEESSVLIKYDVLAQLLTSMMWRQNGEIDDLVKRGLELRPELSDRIKI